MGLIGALWGIAGVLLLLGYAVFKLTPPAVSAFSHDFNWLHWLLLLVNTPLVLYFKGYRALYHGLSKRVAARAYFLRNQPTPARVLFAPLFCMGYFQIIRRKKIATIMMTVGMVFLIIMVRRLDQPWRGILDVSIALALATGWLATLYHSTRIFKTGKIEYPAMVEPETADRAGRLETLPPAA